MGSRFLLRGRIGRCICWNCRCGNKRSDRPLNRNAVNAMKVTTAVKQRVQRLRRGLAKLYPDAHCALHHENPLQLLVATILSAQCTDVRVNMVTPALFARYRTAQDFAAAKPAELETMIQSTGFFRNKTK